MIDVLCVKKVSNLGQYATLFYRRQRILFVLWITILLQFFEPLCFTIFRLKKELEDMKSVWIVWVSFCAIACAIDEDKNKQALDKKHRF